MAAGFESYASDGKLQFNSEMLTMMCRKTGTVYSTAGYNRNYTCRWSVPRDGVSASAICVVRPWNDGVTVAGQGGAGFVGDAAVGAGMNYYWFELSSNIPASNYGLQIRNSAGQVTFSSHHPPMRVVTMLSYGGGYGDYYNDAETFTASGKELGFASGAYSGHSRLSDAGIYCEEGSGPVIHDPNDPNQQCSNWMGYGDSVMYGAYLSNSAQTVTCGIVDHDSGLGTYGGGDYEAVKADAESRNWEMPLKLFVVDVTNIPIGVTFF